MCADSEESHVAGRVNRLARRPQRRRHRILGEPVDLEVGRQPTQLVGDRQVAPNMAEPDRRREVQDAPATARSPRPDVRRGAALIVRSMKSVMARLTGTGSRTRARWPAPSSTTSSPPTSSANARPLSTCWHTSRSPWTTRVGDADAATLLLEGSPVRELQLLGLLAGGQDLAGRLERPRDGVLELLRRVRLDELLAEEELDPAAVLVRDDVPVEQLPAVGSEELVPRRRRPPPSGVAACRGTARPARSRRRPRPASGWVERRSTPTSSRGSGRRRLPRWCRSRRGRR